MSGLFEASIQTFHIKTRFSLNDAAVKVWFEMYMLSFGLMISLSADKESELHQTS